MSVKIIKADDLVNKSLDDIWYLSDIDFVKIAFEDGVEDATGRSVIYSWFFWEFHREIGDIKLLCAHHVGLKKMTTRTHPEFMEQVMWSVYEMCKGRVRVQTLREIAYKITNEIYNKLNVQLDDYVTSSCMLDYLDILDDQFIIDKIEATPKTAMGLMNTKDEITEYLKQPEVHTDNALKHYCETENTNWGQFHHGVTYRGFTTNMDNYFFPNPIMVSYAHGITKFHDSLIESTSSTKSLMAQDDPLKETEFFNKRMQLVSQVIRSLVPGDCGSTEFNTIRVTDGRDGYKSNFDSLLGKKYLKEDGTLGVIDKSGTHLIGKLVKIRSAMNCSYRHTYKICEACYGDLHLNVPEGCNLGYWSAVSFCEIISQMVLSTKHYDGAATIDMIYLDPMTEKIFNVRKKEQDLLIKDVFATDDRRMTITIPPVYNGDQNQLSYLEDLELIDSITNQTVMRKSNIRSFTVAVEDEETGMFKLPPTTITIGNGKDGAYLSSDMLYYIKENGWTVTEKGHYEFDLKDFPKDKPVFILPKKHMNMLEFQQIVSKFMESRGNSKHKSKERLTEFNTDNRKVEQALNRFLEIVSEKVSVNITHLEIFILVCMARDPAKNDARIPKLNEPFQFIPASDAFNKRSMGAVMPYKDQFLWLTKIESYDGSNKVGSPFDGMLMPEIFNDAV